MHGKTDADKELRIARKQAVFCLQILNNKYRTGGPDSDHQSKVVVAVTKDRLDELEARSKRLEEIELSWGADRMQID